MVLKSMKRRTLLCRLDSGVEKPQLLTYPFSPRRLAHEMRAELIHAALTIVRWHHNNGRKPPPGRTFNDFERWDELVAGALVALGEPDPLPTQNAMDALDDESNSVARFFDAFVGQFDNKAVGAAEIVEAAGGGDKFELSPLLVTLTEIMRADDQNALTSQWLGRWLAAHNGDVAGKKRLTGIYDKHAKAWRWRIAHTQ
jgi:putative DNA primase/helicase